jgi:hypothetical protein
MDRVPARQGETMADTYSLQVFTVESLENDKEAFVAELNKLSIAVAQKTGTFIQYDTISLYIPSSGQSPYPIAFQWKFLNVKPKGCKCIYAKADDGTTAIKTHPEPDFSFDNGRILINSLRGAFDLNKRYTLTFRTEGAL